MHTASFLYKWRGERGEMGERKEKRGGKKESNCNCWFCDYSIKHVAYNGSAL